MTWEIELEFCLNDTPKKVFFRGVHFMGKLDDVVNKRFEINNTFLNNLLEGKYGDFSCYVDDDGKWAYIENVMFKLLETDYRTAKSLDSSMWLCEVIAYLEVK